MIWVFEGTPGSGKTLHATEEAIIAMRGRRGGVVANYRIKHARVRRDGSSKWVYRPQEEITPAFLINHAQYHHRPGRESEGLIVLDECHRVLNSRTTWTGRREASTPQLELVRFLAEHRHFGYDVILVIQNLQMLDKHARFLAELRVKHFKWNTFWFLRWCPLPIFGRVTYNAQFPGMKGRLSFSTGIMAYGRYDYQAMRAAVAGAFVPVALAPARGSRNDDGDAATSPHGVREVVNGLPFVAGLVPQVQGDGEARGVGVQRAYDDGDLVAAEGDGRGVVFESVSEFFRHGRAPASLLQRIAQRQREGGGSSA